MENSCRIGIGGPVGSGKTAIIEAITPRPTLPKPAIITRTLFIAVFSFFDFAAGNILLFFCDFKENFLFFPAKKDVLNRRSAVNHQKKSKK